MDFQVGDIFEICDEGFDFEKKIETRAGAQKTIKTSFFRYNNLKYLEITNIMKHNKKKKYKVRLFHQNKKILNERWTMSYGVDIKEPKELYRWFYPNTLKRKLQIGAIQPITWADVAKEQLLEGA